MYIYMYGLKDTLQATFDLPTAVCFRFSLHASSLRGFPTKLARVSSSVLVFSAAHRMILKAAFKYRFKNSMCVFSLAPMHELLELVPALPLKSHHTPIG